METNPDYYVSPLSEDARKHREAKEAELDVLYEGLPELTGVPRLKALKVIDGLEQQLSWQGANPKALPFDELRDHVRSPVGNDPVENKYKARIKNRTTAIRAYCVQCMGGDLAGVRNCPSITCPLFPFRMGKDPLRGWDIPKPEIEPELPEEENVGEFEEEDDNDADETED